MTDNNDLAGRKVRSVGKGAPARPRWRKAIAAPLAGAALLGAMLPAQAVTMQTAGRTTQPIGHYEFCQRAPGECRPTDQAAPHALDRRSWAAMVEVNNHYNTTVVPLTDMQIWGREELWSFPGDVGDCEDFVLAKRDRLMTMGFHASNLLITVVRQPNGEGHAVLTVRTDRGDFILDNLVGAIADWRDTPYTYLKRQSTRHAGRWETVRDDRTRISAAR